MSLRDKGKVFLAMKSKADGEGSPHGCASRLVSAVLPALSWELSLQPNSSASGRQNKQAEVRGMDVTRNSSRKETVLAPLSWACW